MKPVALDISFEDLLGKNQREFSPALRRERWEAWKALGSEAGDGWEPDELCARCKWLHGDWCGAYELPAAVNPILSFRHGLPGFACMGAGFDPIPVQTEIPL